MTMNRRRMIITAVLLVLLGGLGFFGYAIWRHAFVTVPNAYAVWNTARHINDYMDIHQGAWPRNWDDLRKTCDGSNRYNPEHWADLQDRVEVDWTADPRLLASAPEPTPERLPFRVIWLKNGSRVHWGGVEPNWLVWVHLQEPSTRPTSAPAS
jgi:hypothetical protein